MKLKYKLFLLFFCFEITAKGQNYVYDNKIYLPQIKTVQCYNSQKEQSVPLITLKTNEVLLFSFDDLRGGVKNYSYTIEHCTQDWKPSKISSLDYLEGFSEDQLINYKYATNTLQKFTHYYLTLPNTQIKPKIAGNYLLKVYETGNAQTPIITQRFFVLNPIVNVGATVLQSTDVSNRRTKQKINFNIFYNQTLQNPDLDLKAIVMQNYIAQTAMLNNKPAFIKQGALVYNDLNTNEFFGGNEFRKFDTRSFRYKGAQVQEIYRDSTTNITLFTDISQNLARYSDQIDENGNFFIRNQDERNNDTNSDYMNVHFTLNTPKTNGSIYLVGRFNNYTLSSENKLIYDPNKNNYYVNLPLKQGIYDYKYILVDDLTNKINEVKFEGSYFETENNYQIFVYYRRPGGRWQELIGYTIINTVKR